MFKNQKNNYKKGFTIVELLVVIVVIGILAAITIVAYTGLTRRAKIASLESDLSSSLRFLQLFKVDNGEFPLTVSTDCGVNPTTSTNLCLKASDGNDYTTTPYVRPTPQSFTLTATNGELSYYITESEGPIAVSGAPVSASIATYVDIIGDNDGDAGLSVFATSDGGHVTLSNTRTYGVNTPSANQDALIIKYDSSGSISWSKSWGGPSEEVANSIIQTSDGGYAITGYTYSYGSNGDMFVVKYDQTGTIVWNNIWDSSTSDYDEGRHIIETDDGSFVVAGLSYAASEDALLVKYNSSGSLLWSNTWDGGGFNGDSAFSVIETSDGSYAVAGVSEYNVLTLKFSSAGALLWTRTLGDWNDDYGYSIIETDDGGYVTAGRSASYGIDGNTSIILIKYNASGTFIWNKIIGDPNTAISARTITSNNNGGYIIAGDITYFSPFQSDVIILNLDSLFNVLWSKSWGDTKSEFDSTVATTDDNGFAVVGATYSYSTDFYDMFSIKFNSDGDIDDCTLSMCKTLTLQLDDPTTIQSSSLGTLSSIVGSEGSPAALVGSPSVVPVRLP